MRADQQIQALWGRLSPAIEESLRLTGGFTPVGAALRRDGHVETVVAASRTGAPELLEEQARRSVLQGCVAIVRATDVQAQVAEASEPFAGILVRFDNDAGVSQANFMAYAVVDGRISYGELHAQEGAHDLFPQRDR